MGVRACATGAGRCNPVCPTGLRRHFARDASNAVRTELPLREPRAADVPPAWSVPAPPTANTVGVADRWKNRNSGSDRKEARAIFRPFISRESHASPWISEVPDAVRGFRTPCPWHVHVGMGDGAAWRRGARWRKEFSANFPPFYGTCGCAVGQALPAARVVRRRGVIRPGKRPGDRVFSRREDRNCSIRMGRAMSSGRAASCAPREPEPPGADVSCGPGARREGADVGRKPVRSAVVRLTPRVARVPGMSRTDAVPTNLARRRTAAPGCLREVP